MTSYDKSDLNCHPLLFAFTRTTEVEVESFFIRYSLSFEGILVSCYSNSFLAVHLECNVLIKMAQGL